MAADSSSIPQYPAGYDSKRRASASSTLSFSSSASATSSASSSSSSSSSYPNSSSHGRSSRSKILGNMPTTPSAAEDGWWESVLPSGQLAERMRKAQKASASGTTTPTNKSSPNLNATSSGYSTPKASSPAAVFQTRSEHSSPRLWRNDWQGFSGLASSSRGSGHLQFPSTDAGRAAERLRSVTSHRDRVQTLQPTSAKDHLRPPTSRTAAGKQRQIPAEMLAAADPGDGSRLTELKSRSRHHSMLAGAPCPSARSRLLRTDRLSTGRFSPLARTPEMSSGSDEEEHVLMRSHRGAEAGSCATRTQSTFAVSNPSSSASGKQAYQRPSSKTPRVGSRTVSAHSQAMTEQDWADLIQARGLRRGPSLQPGDTCSLPSRRVSFDLGDDEEWRRNVPAPEEHVFHTHGHEYTYRRSSLHTSEDEQHPHWYNATLHRRRTRMLSRETNGQSAHRRARTMSAMPATASSAPVSRRASFNEFNDSRMQGLDAHSKRAAKEAANDLYELPVMRSIHAAHGHLTKTTCNALALSKTILRVPAPVLRPLFHFALIWCVSSATLFALAGCLFASYMLTAWDDVGETGREVRKQAHGLRSWRMNSGSSASSNRSEDGQQETVASSSAESSRRNSNEWESSGGASSAALDAGRCFFDHVVMSPLTYATKWPVAVARSLTPSAVPTPQSSRRSSFAAERRHDGEGGEGGSGAPSRQGSQNGPRRGRKEQGHKTSSRPNQPPNMPPRPPLASLIPSMFLTVLLAIGAGLIGGWAKRRGGDGGTNAGQPPAAAAGRSHAGTSSSPNTPTPIASPRVGSPMGESGMPAYIFDAGHEPSPVGLGIGGRAH